MVDLVDAYHVTNGLTRMAAIDANSACAQHPLEWRKTPWTSEDAAAAREELRRRYEDAKAAGQPLPAEPPPEPAPLTPEEQAALDEHMVAVAEAKERLDAFYAKKQQEREEAEQIARDEAIVSSPPPQPDPTARRPFGRKGEPTAAEKAMIEKKAAKDAADEKLIKDKAEVDKLGTTKAEVEPK
jgi:hypothetical protein